MIGAHKKKSWQVANEKRIPEVSFKINLKLPTKVIQNFQIEFGIDYRIFKHAMNSFFQIYEERNVEPGSFWEEQHKLWSMTFILTCEKNNEIHFL